MFFPVVQIDCAHGGAISLQCPLPVQFLLYVLLFQNICSMKSDWSIVDICEKSTLKSRGFLSLTQKSSRLTQISKMEVQRLGPADHASGTHSLSSTAAMLAAWQGVYLCVCIISEHLFWVKRWRGMFIPNLFGIIWDKYRQNLKLGVLWDRGRSGGKRDPVQRPGLSTASSSGGHCNWRTTITTLPCISTWRGLT